MKVRSRVKIFQNKELVIFCSFYLYNFRFKSSEKKIELLFGWYRTVVFVHKFILIKRTFVISFSFLVRLIYHQNLRQTKPRKSFHFFVKFTFKNLKKTNFFLFIKWSGVSLINDLRRYQETTLTINDLSF